MCLFKVKTPKVANVETPATDLLGSTKSAEPEAPQYGGTTDSFDKKKGRAALKISMDNAGASYNPVSV